MYEPLDAHVLTVIPIIASIMLIPFYTFGVYVFSGASTKKGMQIGAAFLLWGSLMFWVSLSDIPGNLGLAGSLITPLSWFLPSLILYWKRNWFLSQRLSQKWLIGLQILRLLGILFLIEMILGHIPGTFAYPAGLGDILVALVALAVLLAYRKREGIPKAGILLVIGLGATDWLSAFFFGYTSSEVPGQLFYPAVPNDVAHFPIGMIPLFLVPHGIFFHTLSMLNYLKYER